MKIDNKKGFTLIEVLIALGVFSVAIMAGFALAMSNLRIARENYDRVLAANLAREGIELVRSIRDSNWLKIDANEIDTDTGYIYSWDKGLTSGLYIMDCNDNELTAYEGTSNLSINNDELYAHGINGQAIIFSRTITLSNIEDNEEKIGIKINSKVEWERYGKSKTAKAVTELYNWKR